MNAEERAKAKRFWSTMARTSSNRMPSAQTKVWNFTFFDDDRVADLEALCLSAGERDETWRTATKKRGGVTVISQWRSHARLHGNKIFFLWSSISTQFLDSTNIQKSMTKGNNQFHSVLKGIYRQKPYFSVCQGRSSIKISNIFWSWLSHDNCDVDVIYEFHLILLSFPINFRPLDFEDKLCG
jgi:hypothetical protein